MRGAGRTTRLMVKESGTKLVLVKHAIPILDASIAPKHWNLGDEGEAQASLLADNIKSYLPFSLYSSEEAKATKTAKIIALALELDLTIVYGFKEIDRPAGPLLSQKEHRNLNQGIFDEPFKRVLGKESATQALDRFSKAVGENVEKTLTNNNAVIVSHGTVISLFVEKYNKVKGFELWKMLECSSSVVLDFPGYFLRRIENIT